MSAARREAVSLLLACVVAYGTGLGDVAFYTRGEPREGLVVREMLRTGSWLVPARPEGEVARKPPLYYWLAAPALRAMAMTPELALRLPSALVATAAVLGSWALARAVAGAAAGLPAALVLATAFEWARAATSARVDMTLAGSLTLVLAGWMLVLAGRSRRWLVATALGAVLATLTKGPVGLAIPVLAATAWAVWRRDRTVLGRLGVVPVLGAATAVAALWYLVAFAEQGRAFVDVVLKENLVRFIDTDDARTGHAHGLLYLPVVGLVGLLPWVPLLPLVRVPRREPSEPLGFAAVWAIVVVVFFSLANAKRSVYLLPAFPAIAILIGASVAAGGTAAARRAAVLYLPALVALGGVALLLAGGIDPGVLFRRWLRADDALGATAVAAATSTAPFLVAAVGLATLAGALVIERARRAAAWSRLVVTAGALAVAWTALFDGVVHPAVSHTRSLRDFMTRVDRQLPADTSLVASYPTDPGLRFYAPRPLAPFGPEGADAPRMALLWEDEWRRWRDAHGDPLRPLAVSEARQARRGPLALVVVPPGPLERAPAVSSPAREPGLRTDNRSR